MFIRIFLSFYRKSVLPATLYVLCMPSKQIQVYFCVGRGVWSQNDTPHFSIIIYS